MRPLKIALIRETKTPPDRRVALPPQQALELIKKYPGIDLVVEPSEIRCYHDDEYRSLGIRVSSDLSDRDLMIGIKEVHTDHLLPGKSYMFFAHVAKKQAYNRHLLLEILQKNITLIDYEYLTDLHGVRLIAFGRWAGIVGAYNGIRGWGLRTGRFKLKPAHQCHDWEEMKLQLKGLDTGPLRVVVTGGGRVAKGALETLQLLDSDVVDPEFFISNPSVPNMITRLDPWHYAARNDGQVFDLPRFFKEPALHHSTFLPFARLSDLLVTGHYWDPRSPRLWEPEQMLTKDFRIKMIADISCDIEGSVPCTLRASTIADPFFGFDPHTGSEVPPFGDPDVITMMTIDNLPGELPRNASAEFAGVLLDVIMPGLLGDDPDGIICRATIAHAGELTKNFSYLDDFVSGE